MTIPSPDRRRFLRSTAALAMAPLIPAARGLAAAEADSFSYCTFTKPLQHLSYEETAKAVKALGFDGIEAPVRPGGQVLPERVEEDLPKLAAALDAAGLELTLITSGLNEVSEEQRTEAVLRTAAALGVKRFRMAYYRYDLAKPIRPQLAEIKAKFGDLVALAREIGIKPIYQNHSGKDYFGAPVWDLAEVLADFDPAHAGVAFDIGHATVEGAKAWPLHFAAVRPHLDTVYVKEPFWQDNQLGWGPIGEGAVDPKFYKLLKESGFRGPVSLHLEYLGHRELDAAGTAKFLEALGKDFATLRSSLS